MGGHIVNYDSMIVLTHFKGHAMGGFGGSMKNIAIGCADGREGKAQVHGVDLYNQPEDWNDWPGKETLMETWRNRPRRPLTISASTSYSST